MGPSVVSDTSINSMIAAWGPLGISLHSVTLFLYALLYSFVFNVVLAPVLGKAAMRQDSPCKTFRGRTSTRERGEESRGGCSPCSDCDAGRIPEKERGKRGSPVGKFQQGTGEANVACQRSSKSHGKGPVFIPLLCPVMG